MAGGLVNSIDHKIEQERYPDGVNDCFYDPIHSNTSFIYTPVSAIGGFCRFLLLDLLEQPFFTGHDQIQDDTQSDGGNGDRPEAEVENPGPGGAGEGPPEVDNGGNDQVDPRRFAVDLPTHTDEVIDKDRHAQGEAPEEQGNEQCHLQSGQGGRQRHNNNNDAADQRILAVAHLSAGQGQDDVVGHHMGDRQDHAGACGEQCAQQGHHQNADEHRGHDLQSQLRNREDGSLGCNDRDGGARHTQNDPGNASRCVDQSADESALADIAVALGRQHRLIHGVLTGHGEHMQHHAWDDGTKHHGGREIEHIGLKGFPCRSIGLGYALIAARQGVAHIYHGRKAAYNEHNCVDHVHVRGLQHAAEEDVNDHQAAGDQYAAGSIADLASAQRINGRRGAQQLAHGNAQPCGGGNGRVEYFYLRTKYLTQGLGEGLYLELAEHGAKPIKEYGNKHAAAHNAPPYGGHAYVGLILIKRGRVSSAQRRKDKAAHNGYLADLSGGSEECGIPLTLQLALRFFAG